MVVRENHRHRPHEDLHTQVSRSRWHGEGGMEQVSCSMLHGACGMEHVAWSRCHGAGGMEQMSWSRRHGADAKPPPLASASQRQHRVFGFTPPGHCGGARETAGPAASACVGHVGRVRVSVRACVRALVCAVFGGSDHLQYVHAVARLDPVCLVAVQPGRRRDCHSAVPPSTFSRCFNAEGEGMSAK